ncbi:metal-dependent hydrolase [Mycobacterium sp. JS623]|uniref:endonuclease/exonuclease/phosphatase family protein n=1 Tax=Mycobacterium sp. JS623 TaxID=212767 RepID=UPI0002A5583A|nr:endonuclease/exonuclease/phosphatase family protein [Mycobacterium sp. JS623]AGB24960.1 metal-dependent hydrolase [Mycobacterium sp. JS623]
MTADRKLRTLSRKSGAAGTIAGALALAVAAYALIVRYVPLTLQVLAVTAALYPFFICGAVLAMVLFAVQRRWLVTIVAAVLAAAMVLVELPWYIGSTIPAAETVHVRVMSSNLRLGTAIPASLASTAQQYADVLAVQELTPELANKLHGLDATFPYHTLAPRKLSAGVGIWSRYPLEHPQQFVDGEMAVVSAGLRVPGMRVAPLIVTVHLPGPFPKPVADWRRSIGQLSERLRDFAGGPQERAVIVAGDLNATNDMREFRGLLRGGYRDAAEQSGAGVQFTFPSDSAVPPIVAIDHILTFKATAASVHTARVPISDHLALIADIALTPG